MKQLIWEGNEICDKSETARLLKASEEVSTACSAKLLPIYKLQNFQPRLENQMKRM